MIFQRIFLNPSHKCDGKRYVAAKDNCDKDFSPANHN